MSDFNEKRKNIANALQFTPQNNNDKKRPASDSTARPDFSFPVNESKRHQGCDDDIPEGSSSNSQSRFSSRELAISGVALFSLNGRRQPWNLPSGIELKSYSWQVNNINLNSLASSPSKDAKLTMTNVLVNFYFAQSLKQPIPLYDSADGKRFLAKYYAGFIEKDTLNGIMILVYPDSVTKQQYQIDLANVSLEEAWKAYPKCPNCEEKIKLKGGHFCRQCYALESANYEKMNQDW